MRRKHKFRVLLDDINTDQAIEVTQPEEASMNGEPLSKVDANFQTELDYEGYHEIEEYDNTTLSADISRKGRLVKEIRVKDREGDAGSPEESLIDPQENQKPFESLP